MINLASPHSAPAQLSLRMVIASMAAMWLVYFLLATFRGAIVGLEMEQELLWRRALVSLGGVGVTFALWLVLRLFENRAVWVKISAVLFFAVPAALLIAQINEMVFADVRDKVEEKISEKQGFNIRRDETGDLLVDIPGSRFETVDGEMPVTADGDPAVTLRLGNGSDGIDRWRPVFDIALGRYFLLLAWASLYLALLAGAQARAAERREGEFRRAAKAAELRSLRYQVNPHFLFNTLNSLSSLVMTGKTDRAEEMIQSISRFYRHSLTDDPTNDVALEEEFELQRHYLSIEAARFPKRLQTLFDLPPSLAEARIPGMILQPLVENSVKYAVAATARPVTVSLSAREEFGRLVVTVRDNGPGVPDGAQHGFGIGLANVRDRLEVRFGRDAQVHSAPTDQGYCTEIRVPLVKHGF